MVVGASVAVNVGTGVGLGVGSGAWDAADVGVAVGGGSAPKFLTTVVLVIGPESNVAVIVTGVSVLTYPIETTIDWHALPAGIVTADGTRKMSGRLLANGTLTPLDDWTQTVTLLWPSARLAVWV